MSLPLQPASAAVQERARRSRGTSDAAIYQMVTRVLSTRAVGGVLLDVGCGAGQLWLHVDDLFDRYIGIDVVRYDDFPHEGQLVVTDLDRPLPLATAVADVVVAVEVIEHLENPRAFMRELARIARPGGWVIVTTPNNLSALSLMTLARRQRFAAFQDVDYPAHLTALLEVDLRRIAAEAELGQFSVAYTRRGRIPRSRAFWPAWMSAAWPRQFSDNVLLAARKPLLS